MAHLNRIASESLSDASLTMGAVSRAEQRSYSDAERAEAFELMREHGAAEAGRKSGIPGGTLRRWKMERGESGPPSGVAPDDWAAQKEAGAREAWKTAQAALKQVRKMIDAGKMADAQKAAITFAVLVDKSGVLEVGAAAARTRVLNGESAGAPTCDVPNDAARIAEITTILREIGALGDDDDQDRRDDGDERRPPDPASVPEVDQFKPLAGAYGVVRVNGDRADVEPAVEDAGIVTDVEVVHEFDRGPRA